METWFKVDRHSAKITPVRVERTTEHTLLLAKEGHYRPRKTNKETGWERYFSTPAEAKQYLIDRETAIILNLESQLNTARERLATFLELVP